MQDSASIGHLINLGFVNYERGNNLVDKCRAAGLAEEALQLERERTGSIHDAPDLGPVSSSELAAQAHDHLMAAISNFLRVLPSLQKAGPAGDRHRQLIRRELDGLMRSLEWCNAVRDGATASQARDLEAVHRAAEAAAEAAAAAGGGGAGGGGSGYAAGGAGGAAGAGGAMVAGAMGGVGGMGGMGGSGGGGGWDPAMMRKRGQVAREIYETEVR